MLQGLAQPVREKDHDSASAPTDARDGPPVPGRCQGAETGRGSLTSARLALLLGGWSNFPALAQSKSPFPPRSRVTQASLEWWLWPLGPTLVHTP